MALTEESTEQTASLLQPTVVRLSPDRSQSHRDVASQTVPVEILCHNSKGGHESSGSIKSSSTRGTVVRSRQRKAYDYRRMTESLWSPPQQLMTDSGTVAKDGGHLWGRKGQVHADDMQDMRVRRRETVTSSNEGRTISSVGVGVDLGYFVNCARANGTRLGIFSTISNS